MCTQHYFVDSWPLWTLLLNSQGRVKWKSAFIFEAFSWSFLAYSLFHPYLSDAVIFMFAKVTCARSVVTVSCAFFLKRCHTPKGAKALGTSDSLLLFKVGDGVDLASQFIQTTSCICNKVLMEQQELKLIKTRIISE